LLPNSRSKKKWGHHITLILSLKQFACILLWVSIICHLYAFSTHLPQNITNKQQMLFDALSVFFSKQCLEVSTKGPIQNRMRLSYNNIFQRSNYNSCTVHNHSFIVYYLMLPFSMTITLSLSITVFSLWAIVSTAGIASLKKNY
jgi:hypothetical protein